MPETLSEVRATESTGRVSTFVPLCIFALFLVMFLALRTNQFTAVDGALRCLAVYHHPFIFFHGNNHLLYPVDIFTWSRLAAFLGVTADSPTGFLHISQSMNCLGAALTLLCLWLLINDILRDRLLSTVLLAVCGFSHAFLLHATNSAEPVLGLMYAVAGLYVTRMAIRRTSFLLAGLSGVIFALALATYQSMFLALFAGVWIYFSVGRYSSGAPVGLHIRMPSIFLLSFFAAVSIIYGWAYSMQGIEPGWPMIHQFFAIGGSPETYGGFSWSKLVNFLIGFLNNLLPVVPENYAGLRTLAAGRNALPWFVGIIAFGVLVFVPLIFLAKRAIETRRERPTAVNRFCVVGIAAVSPVFWPLLYWDPMYDKLWLLPLAIVAVCLALAIRQSASAGAAKRASLTVLLAILSLEISVNGYRALADSRSPTRGLDDAMRVMNTLRRQDAIVLDFDPISSLYVAYSGNEQSIMLPSLRKAEAERALESELSRCRRTGGKLYFLGILDQTPASWKRFLEDRQGIPFASFNEYRLHSRIVEQFQVNGGALCLRVYDPMGTLARSFR